MNIRKKNNQFINRDQNKPAKPMTIVLMMWLVIVTILTIGLGMVNAYTVVTQISNGMEVRRVLQSAMDGEHYTFNITDQEACARSIRPTPKDPDNCYSSPAEYNRVMLPYTGASLLQLFVIMLGTYGMWTFYQTEKFNLATMLSFLTIILWVLSSLVSAL